ncbi:MAG TPA: rod shape-determining protein RodA [Flavobacteriaceae bacterium]|nr:rod shape-determining protein RodA [Flavobacteriaceae bacterium]
MSRSITNIDWLSVFLYLVLIAFGWVNIYSASYSESAQGFFDFDQVYVKQGLWIVLSFVLIIIVFSIEAKFYERFSSVLYIIALVSLAGLFLFGTKISGATSWYDLGILNFQPTEFAKVATALALAKYLSDIQTDIKYISHQLKALLIIAVPAVLILFQPDAGSALVYVAFFFPMYREGLSAGYFVVGILLIVLFVATLLFGPIWVSVGSAVLTGALLLKYRKRNPNFLKWILITITAIVFVFSVDFIFHNVFEQRHRDRFNIVLGREVDPRGIGYNTKQSEIAIGSGNWFGKGWMQGTQTKGNFVPEQHTDYIFSTVGEEWGFVGSSVIVILFICLLLRLIFIAERQKTQFKRVYGYSVVGILFIHFLVNIGMVIGILPTIGIPLPFFSYGGSALWGFTILLFIFIKLDAERMAF